MRTFIILLAAAIPAFAANNPDLGNSKQARHTLLPIVGYQYLNGEQRGIDWNLDFHTGENSGFPDSVFHYSGSYRDEDDFSPPALGLLYRFRYNERLLFQASGVVLQDRKNFSYPMFYQFFGFTARTRIEVERRNTSWLNCGAAYEFNTPLKWLTGLAQIDLGYAFRDIIRQRNDLENDNSSSFNVKIVEDDKMFSLRGGVDMTIWRQENLILQLGVSYAQFFPIENDVDSFGGFGWRFSVFPVWSGK